MAGWQQPQVRLVEIRAGLQVDGLSLALDDDRLFFCRIVHEVYDMLEAVRNALHRVHDDHAVQYYWQT